MDTPTTEPYAFENLGGIPRTPDKRDHVILGAAGAYTFPATKVKPTQQHYFQGHRPACGAHAGVAMKDMLDIIDGKPMPKSSPRDAWINIKTDGSDPSAGTSMDQIFKILQSVGTVPFEPLENNVTYGDMDYANPKFITPQIKAQEGKNTISSYAYLQDMSFEGLKQAIDDFGSVLILIQVCARFWTSADGRISWAAADVCPLGTPNAQFPVVSAHFIEGTYYDENYIYGPNSFGAPDTGTPVWGLDGDFQFGRDYMPWVIEAGIAHNPPVPVAPEVIAQVQQEMPVVTAMVQHIDSLPQAVKDAHPDWFAQAQLILANMAHALTGKP